jgi:hypothetical protein
MARRIPPRYTPPAAPRVEPALPLVARGGPVHSTYCALDDGDRAGVVATIGLKHCQRIGHRYKVPALRALTDLDTGWVVVDGWIRDDAAAGSPKAFGDLVQPLLVELIDRARTVLGDKSDEPSTDDLAAMAETLLEERSAAHVRLLLAAVVEHEFTAAPQALELAQRDERFAVG